MQVSCPVSYFHECLCEKNQYTGHISTHEGIHVTSVKKNLNQEKLKVRKRVK